MTIGSFTDPIVADPDPSLLAALAAAYRDAAPEAVNPDLDALRDATRVDKDPFSPAADLPTLTVLARDHVVDAVADRFHSASRLAALTEAGVWDLRTLAAPQPNAVFAGRSGGCVLVAAGNLTAMARSRAIAERGAVSAPIRRFAAAATTSSSRTRRQCESGLRAVIGCTVRSGTGAGARSRTRPCDCSTPTPLPSIAARRAAGRTLPVRVAVPLIATSGAPARTPGSGARRRSPG